jgi:glycerol-3-phosphate dehydrogenase (NAD(P)+)
MARVAVIGAGAWGTALSIHTARLKHDVVLWSRDPEVLESVAKEHENTLFLKGFRFPDNLRATGDLKEAVRGAELVILVPPSKFLRPTASSLAGALDPNALVVVASKGIEESTLKLMSEVMVEALPEVSQDRLAFLSGPNFAREIAAGLPADAVIASKEMKAALRVQPLLHSPLYRVYASGDPVGVEIGGSLKNVIAIAAGACDALELGNNARAAIITRGLAEMTRFGVALGADPLTFLGLAGMGDLVLTCTGDLSRNRTLGMEVAKGTDPDVYLASRRTVAEGYFTARAAYDLAQKLGIDAPIIEQVHFVLHRKRPLMEALRALMTREMKDELRGIQTK